MIVAWMAFSNILKCIAIESAIIRKNIVRYKIYEIALGPIWFIINL